MRFHSAMAAMAANTQSIEQFARAMQWDNDRSAATLQAYSTGQYFPNGAELTALGATESLRWAYMVALNAYQLKKLLAVPGNAERLYAILPKATVDKWLVGTAMPSGKSRVKIETEFPGTDLFFGVPNECVYSYVPDNSKISIDFRRSRLRLSNEFFTMMQVSDKQYVIRPEEIQCGFIDAAKDAGLEFYDHGDFMRAEPASKVYIYYAKT